MDSKADYFKELSLRLASMGYTTRSNETAQMEVLQQDDAFCRVNNSGTVFFNDREYGEDIDKVVQQASLVSEYVSTFDSAPKLKVEGLEEKYRQLADFNGVCLAARDSVHGMQFVTWRWDRDHKGVSLGHYFGNDYEGAKQDFAVRSGLVNENRLFNQKQLGQLYRCCTEAQNSDPFMEEADYKKLDRIRDMIRTVEPELVQRLDEIEVQKQMDEIQ